MSKYNPLAERLSGHRGPEWRASFAEIEEVLGFPLPKGARSGQAWWAGDRDKPHAKAWTGGGWRAEVDQGEGAVTFRRSDISPAAVEAAAGLEPVGDLSQAEPPQPAAAPPAYVAGPDSRASAAPAKPRPRGLGLLVAGGVAIAAGATALVLRGRMRR
jgi:hypothetical protein